MRLPRRRSRPPASYRLAVEWIALNDDACEAEGLATSGARRLRSSRQTAMRLPKARLQGSLAALHQDAAVPEVAVHEHRQLERSKDGIRATWKVARVQPVTETAPPQLATEGQLSLVVLLNGSPGGRWRSFFAQLRDTHTSR
jgi:hypothetical protein